MHFLREMLVYLYIFYVIFFNIKLYYIKIIQDHTLRLYIKMLSSF